MKKKEATQPTLPRLLPHHGYRSWTSTWRDRDGGKRTRRFGKEGEVSAREAKARWLHWKRNEWEAKEHVRNPGSPAATYTVRDLAEDFRAHAAKIFVKHGEPTSTVLAVDYGMDALILHYAVRPADSIEYPQIARLRDAMILRESGVPRCITTVNDRLYYVKQAFKLAREKGLVSKETLADVMAVDRLKPGRSDAADPGEVGPVDLEWVEMTKKFATPVVAAMIDTQRLAGMRPAEVCIMRPCDINTTGDVWVYRPQRHKLEHKQKSRQIALGPKVQAIIGPYMSRDLTAYLFSPVESEAQRRDARTAARKTPIGYGNGVGTNRQSKPSRKPGDRYTTASYRKAIHYACDRAFDLDGSKRREKDFSYRWNPNQLRHTRATELVDLYEFDDAGAVLGHNDPATTRIYAKPSLKRAIKVALTAG